MKSVPSEDPLYALREGTKHPAERSDIANAGGQLAVAAGLAPRAAVADAGYGCQPTLLDGWEARALPYVVAVERTATFRLAAAVEADRKAIEDRPKGPRPPYQGTGRPKNPRC